MLEGLTLYNPLPWLVASRLELIVLYLLFLIRMGLYSWDVTDQPLEVRERAWKWWRAGSMILAFSIFAVYSPNSIAYSLDYITRSQSQWIQFAASVLNISCAICLLVGLDVATGKSSKAVYLYVASFFVLVFWVSRQL